MKFVLPLLASISVLAPGLAFAHAMLRAANPPVGSVVHAAPASISLDFSEAVEPGFSKIAVAGTDGKTVDRGDLHAAEGNPKRLVLGLRPLAAGTYSVTWHAVSVDTHKTQGSYSFTVAP